MSTDDPIADRLGALQQVDLRDLWPNEAADFTPWLALDDNVHRLGEAVGIELIVEGREVPVGPYSADIVARETTTDRFLVIENQLEKTDHDHLAKALTYAAVLDATTVIWIAREFSEEHRKALDWLNDNSSEELSFFGVRVELWQIDQSRPAVRFTVVSRPTGFLKRAAIAKAAEDLTDAKRLQLEFWTAFAEALDETKQFSSIRSPRPQYWFNVTIGRRGAHISNLANVASGFVGVRLYLMGRFGGEAMLAGLSREREAIEHEIGAALEWNPNEDARDKTIRITRAGDITDRSRWPEYIGWMIDMTIRFRDAFGPRVKRMVVDAVRRASEPAEDPDTVIGGVSG